MTPGPGIEPGTHWWEASALTTAPTLLPKLNGERFDLFWFVFVRVVLHLLSLSLSYHLLSNFFLDQKKVKIKLDSILVLLGSSREILSAAVLDSTDAKCINT